MNVALSNLSTVLGILSGCCSAATLVYSFSGASDTGEVRFSAIIAIITGLLAYYFVQVAIILK